MISDTINWYEIGVAAVLLMGGLLVGGYRLKDLLTSKKKNNVFGEKTKLEEPSKKFPIDLKVHCTFHEKITEVRINNDLEFVAIGNFHNGSSFLDGSHMKKMSWVFESVSLHHKSYIKYFQDILLSSMVQILRPLIYGEKCSYVSKENIEQGLIRSFLEVSGIDNLLVFPIANRSGYVVGMLWLGWNNQEFIKTGEQEEIRKKTLIEAGQALVQEIEFEIPNSK